MTFVYVICPEAASAEELYRYRLSLNRINNLVILFFYLDHYNLSIVHVSNKDEGIFQCQVQRTMNAHEARSERVHLTLIGMIDTWDSFFIQYWPSFSFLLASPNGQPTLLLPNMPLKQGQSANITCLSSPSKPASRLILYKNEQLIPKESSSIISYELDIKTKKNLTKLVYIIDDPDSSWDNARIRCEQIYQYVNNFHNDVSRKIQVHCKFFYLSL